MRLSHVQDWFYAWVPESIFCAGQEVSSVDAWNSTSIDFGEGLSNPRQGDFHIFVADVVEFFDTVDRDILCALGRIGLPSPFATGLGVGWTGDGGIPKGALSAWSLMLPFIPLGAVTGRALKGSLHNNMLITLNAALMAQMRCLLLLSIFCLRSGCWAGSTSYQMCACQYLQNCP